jgi:hypothetical protein
MVLLSVLDSSGHLQSFRNILLTDCAIFLSLCKPCVLQYERRKLELRLGEVAALTVILQKKLIMAFKCEQLSGKLTLARTS